MTVWKVKHSLKRCFSNLILMLVTGCLLYSVTSLLLSEKVDFVRTKTLHVIYDAETRQEYVYDRNSSLIFIGGAPRSGTTLMRALLDTHPNIRCGEETRVLPRLLNQRRQWVENVNERRRLIEAGVSGDVLDNAVAAFILEIIAKHGRPAERLCNKDPLLLKALSYLHEIFPNGKYLLMVRDGRATVHSIISRRVRVGGYDNTNYRDCLIKWNSDIEKMYNQCLIEGASVCLPVYYENLILHPEEWTRRVLEFLEVPWDDRVLHHQDEVGKPGGISLSKNERSSDQVMQPIYKEALAKWVGHIPQDVLDDMHIVAPMLKRLGYNPFAKEPSYRQTNTQGLPANKKISPYVKQNT